MENDLDEELARRETVLRSAQAQLSEASSETYEQAAQFVEGAQARVDNVRGEFLPEACREALGLLVEHATHEWLESHPLPTSEGRREFVDLNIKVQLLGTLFHPELEF